MDTVEQTSSAGEVTPEVAQPTPDPMEEKIARAVSEALLKQREEQARKIQSEVDKRVAPLQRRLTEAERRAQLLEGTLTTLPNTLGDVDPEVRMRAQLASNQGQLNYYRSRDQEKEIARQIEEAKQATLEDAKDEISSLGIDPGDSRLAYDLDMPDAKAFRRKLFESVSVIQKSEKEKEKADLDTKLAKAAVDIEARIRKATGVDSQDSAGAAPSGKPTFTTKQIRDRKFYEGNREAIDLASKEGRIVRE